MFNAMEVSNNHFGNVITQSGTVTWQTVSGCGQGNVGNLQSKGHNFRKIFIGCVVLN